MPVMIVMEGGGFPFKNKLTNQGCLMTQLVTSLAIIGWWFVGWWLDMPVDSS